MRSAKRLMGFVTLATAITLLGGCDDAKGDDPDPAGPRCGNGVAEAGETPTTCCADAGCPFGVCDTTANRCVDPWLFTCPSESDLCAIEQPYVCDAQPPSYDCARCGCPDGHTCYESYCYSDDMPAREDTTYGISRDLPVDDYFAFVDWVAAATPLTYAELVDELDARLREDARRAALLLGESHGSDDEQAVGLQLLVDLYARGWPINEIGVEGGTSPLVELEPIAWLGFTERALFGNLTNVAYCAGATSGVGTRTNSDGLYVQYTGSGHTSQEACHHPEHWSICDMPHTAECVAAIGRKALVVILFDPAVWMTVPDNVLLWRLAEYYPNEAQVTDSLDAFIAAFETHMAGVPADARFAATVQERAVNVRILQATHADDVFFAFFPRPEQKAFLMRAFRAVWQDAALRAYLLAHDIRPTHCSIGWNLTPGEETYSLYCDNNDHLLEAQVDGITFLLESSTTTP